jgi:hypothetical protein
LRLPFDDSTRVLPGRIPNVLRDSGPRRTRNEPGTAPRLVGRPWWPAHVNRVQLMYSQRYRRPRHIEDTGEASRGVSRFERCCTAGVGRPGSCAFACASTFPTSFSTCGWSLPCAPDSRTAPLHQRAGCTFPRIAAASPPACLPAPPPTTKGDDGWGVQSLRNSRHLSLPPPTTKYIVVVVVVVAVMDEEVAVRGPQLRRDPSVRVGLLPPPSQPRRSPASEASVNIPERAAAGSCYSTPPPLPPSPPPRA